MKNKYVMMRGLAFSEKSDMEMLSSYAKKGWILEGISRVSFYKLRQDKPQDIQYSLDYQDEATKEYFDLFTEAGWTHVVSIGNLMHIFSAPAGTKPIYTESTSEVEKYYGIRNKMKKGSIYSAIVLIALAVLSLISVIFIKPIVIPVCLLFFLSLFAFISSFMSYLTYGYQIKKLKENGNNGSNTNFKLFIVYAFLSIYFLFAGIDDLTKKKYFFAFGGILIAAICIHLTISYYKKKKQL